MQDFFKPFRFEVYNSKLILEMAYEWMYAISISYKVLNTIYRKVKAIMTKKYKGQSLLDTQN